MKRKSFFMIFVFGLFLIGISGCQSREKKIINQLEKQELYRYKLEEAEKEQGYAEFELMENVLVKASITPLKEYKNGLKKYYMEQIYETDELANPKEIKKNPVLYGKKIDEIWDILEGQIHACVDRNDLSWNFQEESVGMYAPINAKNGYEYRLCAFWSTSNKRFHYTSRFYYPELYLRLEMGINSYVDLEISSLIEGRLWNYSKYNVFSLEEEKKLGKEICSFLEKLTGRTVNNDWKCIPVCRESVKELKRIAPDAVSNLEDIPLTADMEYCAFRYYYDIDGLPYKALSLTYNLQEDEKCSEISRYATPGDNGKQLFALDVNPLQVCVSENGILNITTNSNRKVGKVYKEAEKVIDPNEILENVKEYYEKQLLFDPVIITNVELVYSSYFTDYLDGKIEPAICPYWVVKIYDTLGERGRVLTYDAFTGEAMY